MVSMLLVTIALLAAGQQPGAANDAGKTSRPAAAAAAAGGRAEYLALRAKTADTADAHWKLGLWCERNGLKAEAQNEFQAVTQLDSRREAAWKKLGYVKHDGRWITAAQQTAAKAETEAQRKADAHYRPLLQKWKTALKQKTRRSEAEGALAAINDTRAVPSIWTVFGLGSALDQERAVDMLGHIESDQSSRALAALAIFGKTDLVRRAAVETVKRRKADDVLIAWIALLRAPVKYEVRQVAGPGMPGVLFVEGDQFNVRRFYTPPTDQQTQHMIMNGPTPESSVRPTQYGSGTPPGSGPPDGSKCVGAIGDTSLYVFDYTWAPPPPPPGPTQSYQQYERTVLQARIDRDFVLDETAKMAQGAQAQLQQDVNLVEQANATTRERNARISEALGRVAGVEMGEDREAWLKWWMQRMGYSYIPPEQRTKKTMNVQVPLPYVPQKGPDQLTQGASSSQPQYCMLYEHDKGQNPRWGPCFAAGTPIATPDGQREIQTLGAGDRVVSGEGLQARHMATIHSVHQFHAARTLRLLIAGEAIVTTDGHPFLKPGSGWTRAGALKPGDLVQSARGPARVEASESVGGGTVYNLLLADGDRFLVGTRGFVVHDISAIDERDDRPGR